MNSEKYEFLRTNPHLGNKIIFLTLGGSYAYGTNVDTSDIDVRGCALNSRSDILGLSNFEQVVNNETDTTIYGFNKLVSLLLNCNPNTIELLGCKPEQYFMITDIGKEMVDNRKMFLSQRAAKSFGGYATAQLRRLENAIARDAMSQSRKEEHIRNSMESSLQQFKDRYEDFNEGSIKLYTGESKRDDLDTEILVDRHRSSLVVLGQHIDAHTRKGVRQRLACLTVLLPLLKLLEHLLRNASALGLRCDCHQPSCQTQGENEILFHLLIPLFNN